MHIDDPVVPRKKTPFSYLPHALIIIFFILSLSGFSFDFIWWLYAAFTCYVFFHWVIDWSPMKTLLNLLGGLLITFVVALNVPPQFYLAGMLVTILHGMTAFSGMFTEKMEYTSRNS